MIPYELVLYLLIVWYKYNIHVRVVEHANIFFLSDLDTAGEN
jgi:hypothetical protein